MTAVSCTSLKLMPVHGTMPQSKEPTCAVLPKPRIRAKLMSCTLTAPSPGGQGQGF